MSEEKRGLSCKKCGQLLDERAKFCFVCGEKVVRADEKTVCYACGASVSNGFFCSECGASLVKKKGEEVQSAVTVGFGSIDDQLCRAEEFLSLECFERAAAIYGKIVDDHPMDYRGWWGIFVSQTQGLTDEFSADTDVSCALIIKNVKKLAPAEEYAKCEEKFLDYCAKIDAKDIYVEDEELMAKLVLVKLKQAQKLLDEGAYTEAKTVYETISEDHPMDYRGWWGILVSATQNLTKPLFMQDNAPIGKITAKIKELASPEEYDACKEQFANWVKTVHFAGRAEKEDKQLIKRLDDLQKARIPFLDAKKAYESIEVHEKEEYEKAASRRSDNIFKTEAKIECEQATWENCNRSIEEKEKKRGASIFFIILGIILSIIGFGSCVSEGEPTTVSVLFLMLGLFFALIVGGLLRSSGETTGDENTRQEASQRLATLKKELSKLTEDQEEARQRVCSASESRAKSIAFMDEKLAVIDDVIEKARARRALEEEQFNLYYTEQFCRSFGFECSQHPTEEALKIITEEQRALIKPLPVLLRCDKCENYIITYVSRLAKHQDNVECPFCNETVYVSKFLNEDGTPNVMELRRGVNYRRYLHYEGLDEEYDEEYDELYDDSDEAEYECEDEEYESEDEEEYEPEDESHEVYLVSEGSYPEGVIKVLDDVLCCGRAEAREIAMEAEKPCYLTSTSKEEAELLASRLRAAGATVKIEDHT